MSEKTTAERVNEILMEELYTDNTTITSDCSLSDEFGMDSLDQVEIAMKLEREFNICIDDIDLDDFDTPARIVVVVEKHLTTK